MPCDGKNTNCQRRRELLSQLKCLISSMDRKKPCEWDEPPCPPPKCCPVPPRENSPACYSPLKPCNSCELRSSLMWRCLCIKRNGLQDRCMIIDCLGRPECMTKLYPICGPGKKALLKLTDRGDEEAALRKFYAADKAREAALAAYCRLKCGSSSPSDPCPTTSPSAKCPLSNSPNCPSSNPPNCPPSNPPPPNCSSSIPPSRNYPSANFPPSNCPSNSPPPYCPSLPSRNLPSANFPPSNCPSNSPPPYCPSLQSQNPPSPNFPSGNFPSPNFPSGNFPSPNFPSSNFPSPNFPSGNFSSPNFPSSNFSPPNFPPPNFSPAYSPMSNCPQPTNRNNYPPPPYSANLNQVSFGSNPSCPGSSGSPLPAPFRPVTLNCPSAKPRTQSCPQQQNQNQNLVSNPQPCVTCMSY